MPPIRRLVALLLVGSCLVLLAGTAFAPPDFSWTQAYFDGDDDDFLSLLLTERIPLLSVAAVALVLLSATVARVGSPRASARSLAAPRLSRLRSPPLFF